MAKTSNLQDAVIRPGPKQGLNKPGKGRLVRALGLGVITGAADDDPSAIGTYASAGAKFGPALLWMAPVTFPMMFSVVYLSAKLGQVGGEGLFALLRRNYSRKVLYPTLAGVLIGNTVEAGADLGGVAAALNLLLPIPIPILVLLVGIGIFCLQLWGSYVVMRNIFDASRLLSWPTSQQRFFPGRIGRRFSEAHWCRRSTSIETFWL